MNDLIERIEAAQITESSPVLAKVTGTFLKRDAISLNNRFYPAETVQKVVTKAQQAIEDSGSLPVHQLVRHGDADSDDSLKVVGKVTKVWMEGDLAKYEAEIPDTTAGRDTATLVQGGFIKAVSLRAKPGTAMMTEGKVDGRTMDIVQDFDLEGIDYTLSPGIADVARVEDITIFESVDPAKVGVALSEELNETATYARSWYETMLETAAAHLLDNVTIDVVEREWLPLLEAKKFESPGHYTKADRDKIDAKDFAGPGRTFPIVTQADVDDAAKLVGHADDPDAVKQKIIKIAKRKGFSLPDSWQDDKKKESVAMNDDKTQVKEAGSQAGTTPALNEDNMHTHGHTHEGGSNWSSYQHEHPHSHDSAGMDHHDSMEAHRHGHAEESAKPANHTHTPVERAVISVLSAVSTLKECDMTDAELQQCKKLVKAADMNMDKLMGVMGVPDEDEDDEESLKRIIAGMTEKGAAISNANQGKLAQAHDHIANVLGMECAPKPEESTEKMVKRLIKEALGEVRGEVRKPAVSENVPSQAAKPDGKVDALIEAVKTLAESQTAMAKQMAALSETVPAKAAEAAAKVAWRPERKTIIAENADVNTPGGGDERAAFQARLNDRSIPVEQRLKMATDQIADNAGIYNTLASFGAFDDSGVLADG